MSRKSSKLWQALQPQRKQGRENYLKKHIYSQSCALAVSAHAPNIARSHFISSSSFSKICLWMKAPKWPKIRKKLVKMCFSYSPGCFVDTKWLNSPAAAPQLGARWPLEQVHMLGLEQKPSPHEFLQIAGETNIHDKWSAKAFWSVSIQNRWIVRKNN